MNQKAKKYIVSVIDNQAKSFPCLSFKYGYDNATATHIIGVQGKDDNCLASDSWQEVVYDIREHFENKFKDESLLFVSTDSLVSVDDYEIIHSAIARVGVSKTRLLNSWSTMGGKQEGKPDYTYNPNTFMVEGKIREPSDFSLDFSPHKESALTSVKAGFFY